MSQSVKVKVRPGEILRFPGICAHCAQPAAELMSIKRRRGRVTRLIDVPVCLSCSRELGRKSGEEERWQRQGLFVAAVFGLAVFIIGAVMFPGQFPVWFRLLVVLLIALFVSFGVRNLFIRKSMGTALPQKKAIMNSARMNYFSWRATTFEFENETFIESFIELNEADLMEI